MQFCFIIILMQEGLKHQPAHDSQPPLTHNCDHVFLLRRLSDTQRQLEIRADFSYSPKDPSTSFSKDLLGQSALPTFNRDNLHFTPSFVLVEDKARFDQNIDACLANHLRKIEEIVQEKEELLVPKPSKGSRFCLICKQNYEDYLTHINYPSHNALLKQSQFYGDVLEFCRKRNPICPYKAAKKIAKERKKKEPSTASRKKQLAIPKSSEALSTGLQSCEEAQLCGEAK